eukprot:670896-Rhodomonas_salina.7
MPSVLAEPGQTPEQGQFQTRCVVKIMLESFGNVAWGRGLALVLCWEFRVGSFCVGKSTRTQGSAVSTTPRRRFLESTKTEK